MKVVVDTNVLISALLFKGISGRVFDYCMVKEEVILSPWILDEFQNKLLGKFKLDLSDVNEIIDTIEQKSNVIQPENELPNICRDEDDNNILQLAEYIEADYIITGDKDLLILEQFKGTLIISPGDFNALISES